MIFTEEELRQAWDNGRGSLPEYPEGTRFTPSAKDFLAARQGDARQGDTVCGAADTAPAASPLPGRPSRRELVSPDGKRLILTSMDVDALVAEAPETLVVHPSVTLTDSARERLGKVGVRIVPWLEKAPDPPMSGIAGEGKLGMASALAQGSKPTDADFAKIKAAVLARLCDTADEALVEVVIRKVLASI